jgi:uncharacterized protein YbjT (DUF2867 family)
MEIKVIITGATGMVGEGVLLECLSNPQVKEVLSVSRKPYGGAKHPKLKECIVPDFFNLDSIQDQLSGFDACFYCAGISSNGLNESEYTHITYDTVMHFANKLVSLSPEMVFGHISGSHTDSSEKGSIMWARVKGKTENAFMKPTEGQVNVKGFYKAIASLYPLLRLLMPGRVSTLREVGQAMINSVLKGYPKPILEVSDIKILANGV